MTRRERWLVVASLLLGLVALGVGLVYLLDVLHRPSNGVHVERVKADLEERLPDGSSWEQAEAWFASYGVRPEYIEEDGRRVGMKGAIENSSLAETAEISVYLYFSPEGRLVTRRAYRWQYDP